MMEERDNKTTPSQATSYSTSVPGPSLARMAAVPQTPQAHNTLPMRSQQQQQYYPQTNGHDATTQQSLAPPPPQQQQQQQQQQPQQQLEYRMPPNALPAVSLPPIQHFEPAHNTMPSQPQYPHMPNSGAQHQMTQPHVAYQYQNGSMPMMPPNGQALYTTRDAYAERRYTPPPLHPYQAHILPHNPMDPRQMSGGRHKKEIKRRTKTGCLTCRKRRIKCDERQPGCRNCEKSKRECLGYDPIFKQQSGPASIQPAPLHALPKPDTGMTPVYPQTPYQDEQDIYNAAVRGQPQTAPTNGTYTGHTYAQPLLGATPGSSAVPQLYHPPFDPSHKSEQSQQSKV